MVTLYWGAWVGGTGSVRCQTLVGNACRGIIPGTQTVPRRGIVPVLRLSQVTLETPQNYFVIFVYQQVFFFHFLLHIVFKKQAEEPFEIPMMVSIDRLR